MFYNDPLEISAEAWAGLLMDREVTTESDLSILKLVYESRNHELRASEIASILGMSHHGPINLQISRFSKRVLARTGVPPSLSRRGRPRWWHVPFLAHREGGVSLWIMRPELVMALEIAFGEDDSQLIYSGEIADELTPSASEGAMSRVLVNRYERSRRARSMSIAHHGHRCIVCDFDFEQVYGPAGKDKIHVHHLIPLSEIQREYEIDPVRDLCPVCPNCHLIIHSRKEPFTIEEMRETIRAFRNRQ